MKNYEMYKDFYNNNVLSLPGDKRTEKLLYFVFKYEPNITLQEFFDLEDKLIMNEE